MQKESLDQTQLMMTGGAMMDEKDNSLDVSILDQTQTPKNDGAIDESPMFVVKGNTISASR